MDSNRLFQQVREFHAMIGEQSPTEPRLLTRDELDLREYLIREEIGEIEDAHDNKDLVEIADAIGDTMYVIAGTALKMGVEVDVYIPGKFDTLPALANRELILSRINSIRRTLEAFEIAWLKSDFNGCVDSLEHLMLECVLLAIEFSIPIFAVIDEIHRSNMTKHKGWADATGKWKKGPDYEPPVLEPILFPTRAAQ